MARRKKSDTLNLDLTPKKVRGNNTGKVNQPYSLKVSPRNTVLANFNGGVVNATTEEEALETLRQVVEVNGGATKLREAGIKLSLYKFRNPLRHVGAAALVAVVEEDGDGIETTKFKTVAVSAAPAAPIDGRAVANDLAEMLEEQAANIRAAREAGDESLVAELLQDAIALSHAMTSFRAQA